LAYYSHSYGLATLPFAGHKNQATQAVQHILQLPEGCRIASFAVRTQADQV
jgi:hypothetical protein